MFHEDFPEDDLKVSQLFSVAPCEHSSKYGTKWKLHLSLCSSSLTTNSPQSQQRLSCQILKSAEICTEKNRSKLTYTI
jgi:hypothetical protein